MINWLVGLTVGVVGGYTIARVIDARAVGVPPGKAITNPFTPLSMLAPAPSTATAATQRVTEGSSSFGPTESRSGPGHFKGWGWVS